MNTDCGNFVRIVRRTGDYEYALKALNDNLDEFRAAGDIKAVESTLVLKEAVLKEMGAKIAKDYIEIYGDK